MPEDQTLRAVSLYSGAGGLDLGFVDAGFEIVWAVESDLHAVRTYRANIGDHVLQATLPGPLPMLASPLDLVIGGPPCQGFSVIGRMDPGDKRSEHVFNFLRVVEALQPRGFVMENVKALASSPRWAPIRSALRERARALGYRAKIFVLNAAHFEVPQARERMFMIGIKEGEPIAPSAVSAEDPPSVGQTLRGLPPYGSPGNDGVCAARVIPAETPVMRPTAYKGSLLFNGSGRPLNLEEPAKTLPASMGGNATPIVDQAELANGEAPWVVEYHRHLMQGGLPLAAAPRRMRRITTQEAAALQTFPPGWWFSGPQVARYRQIGNAVPPKLAYHVALAVRTALLEPKSERQGSEQSLAAAAA